MASANMPKAYDNDNRFDIISALPREISSMIFRMLDPRSMQSAMVVRKSWYRAYKSDHALPQIMKEQADRQEQERLRKAIYFTAASVSNPNRRANKRRRQPSDHKQPKRKIQRTAAHIQQPRNFARPRSMRM